MGYGTMKLEGSTADTAVNCMKSEGLIPSTVSDGNSTVILNPNGGIEVSQDPGLLGRLANVSGLNLIIEPAGKASDAVAGGNEFVATGPIAEDMRKRAEACVLKSIKFTP